MTKRERENARNERNIHIFRFEIVTEIERQIKKERGIGENVREKHKKKYLYRYIQSSNYEYCYCNLNHLANSFHYGVADGLPVHDGLEDGGEGSDPDPGSDEDRVLGVEDLTENQL